MYANLTEKQHYKKTYCEVVMQVSAQTFRKLANELLEKVTDKNDTEHKVWIVLATFCTMQSINDTRYFPGDITLEAERLNNPRENNVQFLQSRSP